MLTRRPGPNLFLPYLKWVLILPPTTSNYGMSNLPTQCLICNTVMIKLLIGMTVWCRPRIYRQTWSMLREVKHMLAEKIKVHEEKCLHKFWEARSKIPLARLEKFQTSFNHVPFPCASFSIADAFVDGKDKFAHCAPIRLPERPSVTFARCYLQPHDFTHTSRILAFPPGTRLNLPRLSILGFF